MLKLYELRLVNTKTLNCTLFIEVYRSNLTAVSLQCQRQTITNNVYIKHVLKKTYVSKIWVKSFKIIRIYKCVKSISVIKPESL